MEIDKKEKINRSPVVFPSSCRFRCLLALQGARPSPSKCVPAVLSAGSRTCRRTIRPICSTCSGCSRSIRRNCRAGHDRAGVGRSSWASRCGSDEAQPDAAGSDPEMIFDWMPLIFTFMLAAFPAACDHGRGTTRCRCWTEHHAPQWCEGGIVRQSQGHLRAEAEGRRRESCHFNSTRDEAVVFASVALALRCDAGRRSRSCETLTRLAHALGLLRPGVLRLCRRTSKPSMASTARP